MTHHSHEVLSQIIEGTRQKDYPTLKSDDYFEIFAAQQILKKRRFDLDPDEIASGIVGGYGDGGVDGFYIFINRKLIREGMDTSIFDNQRLNIELVISQAKNKPSFEESVPLKLKDFVENCLQLGADPNAASTLYSERFRDAVRVFHNLYREGLPMQPSLTITFFHASHADHVDGKVKSRGELLISRTREFFPAAQVDYQIVTGSELIELHHQRPESTLSLKTARYFDFNSYERTAYVCVSAIADFYAFITDGNVLRKGLFEANVRDHAPDVKVNKGIRATLENPEGDDFWWLNNGITIIASNAVYHSGSLQITNPLIVNGLQTSYELFEHFSAGGNRDDKRVLMIKVIVNDRSDTSDRIINATNSQTKIESISLHATETVQRNVEIALKMKGYYYDRRKNFYRNQGVAVARIVTIPYMAQALAAIVLQQPDQARARPGSIAEKSYELLFSKTHPPALYGTCIDIMKRVDIFMSYESNKRNRLNLVFYMAMLVTCTYLRSIKPKPQRISTIDVQNVQDSLLESSYALLVNHFEALGGDDRAAKGPQLLDAIKKHLGNELKREAK